MRKRIFLADDSVTIQRVVELTFPEPEFEVVCVSNGAQAIERVSGFTPDIALLDVVMPEKSGYDVCAHIKSNPTLKWMPVLLISGTFDPYDEKRATEAGAAGRLTKPFESRGLVTRVEELIAAHPNPNRAVIEAATTPAPERPSQARPPVPAQELRASTTAAGQAMRMTTAELFEKVPAGPAGRAAAAPPAQQQTPAMRQATPAEPAQAPVVIPAEMLERAVREAVSSISDKVIREVAWEVIPDIAEAIITRRIRELEEEAGRTS